MADKRESRPRAALETPEQIERWRSSLRAKYMNSDLVDSLCDLAIKGLTCTRSETPPTEAPKPDPIADLCEKIKQDIRLCDHGYIHITCGDCNRAWNR